MGADPASWWPRTPQIALDANGEVVGVGDAYIDTDKPPASTAVQVVALIRPELILEVEAYAVVADR
jgi:enamine deaminase RidA (YjgF/YER057c/UK114 family)